MPIPLIIRLKMSSAQRYGVCIILALGYIVCAAGAMRTYYLYVIGWRTTDIIWYEYPAFLASAIENDLGIVSLTMSYTMSLIIVANRPHRFVHVFHSYVPYAVNTSKALLDR
jgi:hypothetical protein